MEDDDVLPDPNHPAIAAVVVPAPGVPAGSGSGSVTCEFCDCRLLRDGAVLRTSDRARAFQRADETIADLKAEIARLKKEKIELETRIPKPSERRGSVLDW